MSLSPAPPSVADTEPEAPEDAPLKLTPGWIALGIAALTVGIAMGFIMSSVWLVR